MSELYRFLGDTGVKVSKLCLGTMTFGTEWTQVASLSQAEADALVGRALDAGINFFDTADVYHGGQSEEYLARALGARRAQAVIATKVRGRVSPDANDVGLSRRHVRRSVEQSLRRLDTDYIDLYQVHGWDARTPLEETLSTLDDLVREGKVRYLGASNFAGWQLARALGVSERRGWERFVTLQPLYNVLQRELELELLPLCRDQRLGVLPWSPLAGGLLAGVLGTIEGGRRAGDWVQEDLPKHRPRIEAYETFCEELGERPADVALAWVLANPAVTAPIIGPRTLEQLDGALRALELTLDEASMARLDEIFPGPGGAAPEAYAW